ncbi:MAG: SpoIIE family protein phosphatase [Planctomycetaceae bacterium]|jgi:sigma-B regulation protein RsbU (phosphoserine phosphatase)|nr:SpoIIE family protein phosphatase [Planctomycetaceae bacterium]
MRNIFSRLSISNRLLLGFLSVSILSAILYLCYGYYVTQKALLHNLDRRLFLSAVTIEQLLPDDFIDRCMNRENITVEEKSQVMNKILMLLKNSGMSILYVVAYDSIDDRYILVIATKETTKEEPEKGVYVVYNNPYPNIIQTLHDGITRFEEGSDDYGYTRSAFLRRYTLRNRPYVVGADIDMKYVNQIKRNAFFTFLSIAAALLIVSILFSWIISRRLIAPIRRLRDYMNRLIESHFSADLQIPSDLIDLSPKNRNESFRLAADIDRMHSELSEHIVRLQLTTKAKEQAESEMRIAGKVQASYLPLQNLESEGIELSAKLLPARFAAGDLYDYVKLDDGRLFFTIGDVSGKGIPAALFMTMTLTLIRVNRENIALDKLMNWINNSLVSVNSDNTFVTLVVGIVDPKTGEVIYCNGGHNPPILCGANGECVYEPKTKSTIVGVFSDITFPINRLYLGLGDRLIFYTDGITEAMSSEGILFGEQRLLELVQKIKIDETSSDSIERIIATVQQFEKSQNQSDDITTLCIHRKSLAHVKQLNQCVGI